jgi:signal peptidase
MSELVVETAAGGTSRSHSLLASTRTVANVVVILALIGSWFVFLRPQFLGGPAAYVLVSGQSMEPTLHHDDFVLVGRQDAYEDGDIVAYRIPESDTGAGAIVIHRIIGGSDESGYLLQGDNRTTPDRWRPRSTDVLGRSLVTIPRAGTLLPFLRSPLIVAAFAGCMAFFFVYFGARRPESSETDGSPAQHRGGPLG